MTKEIQIGLVSLGCSKNQVDAERLLARFRREGWLLQTDLAKCDVAVVNTCGFIEDAKRESIETILLACDQKKAGRLRSVVVTGCLSERYREELAAEIPEVDVVVGIGSNSEIVELIRRSLAGEKVQAYGSKDALSLEGERVLGGPEYTAYVKVAEGCDNCCSYCAIPLIRGGFRSRPMENIVEECRQLAAQGVKELNLVAQDTSRYGEDLYGGYRLPQLIDAVCEIEGVHWVRVLYCYPDHLTEELMDTMARQPKVCKYIDLPVQHASGRILREMNRTGDRASILALLQKLRERIPGVTVRTTLIAGFPGETDQDFEELTLLVQEGRFERLGCFAYSQEEGTPAGAREDQLDPQVRNRRAELIIQQQMEIAFAVSQAQVGRTLEVLVEGKEEGYWVGRSEMDAPDIDTRVYFTGDRDYRPGDFVPVRVTEARGYDIMGCALEE